MVIVEVLERKRELPTELTMKQIIIKSIMVLFVVCIFIDSSPQKRYVPPLIVSE